MCLAIGSECLDGRRGVHGPVSWCAAAPENILPPGWMTQTGSKERLVGGSCAREPAAADILRYV
jgi:hypothetical protein